MSLTNAKLKSLRDKHLEQELAVEETPKETVKTKKGRTLGAKKGNK